MVWAQACELIRTRKDFSENKFEVCQVDQITGMDSCVVGVIMAQHGSAFRSSDTFDSSGFQRLQIGFRGFHAENHDASAR